MQTINVDINKGITERCLVCDSIYFRKRMIIKKIPAILCGTLKDQFINVEFWACEQCGTKHHSVAVNIDESPKAPLNGRESPPTKD